jgi:DNA-binding LacI/PurR family transcriptional regulator
MTAVSSVREIAEQAGVSITTVSRALNNDATVNPKTRERIVAVANRFGYVATVGRRNTNNLGFLYLGEQTINHPYDCAVLAGVAQGVDECRFDVVVLDLRRDKRRDENYTQFFMRKGVRGVIIRTMAESRHICRDIAREGFPHVVVSERFEDNGVCCIDCESRSDSRRAVEYLIALGHRRIAFGVHNIPDRDHNDRFDGYKEALANHGIAFRDDLVFRHQYTLAGGQTVMTMIASMPQRPTAVYFADPMMGVGAVRMAHELGLRIPGDISVIGFDDSELRFSVYPTLTTVCQDAQALGFEAALHLTRMIRDGNVKTGFQKTLPTFFEVHDSTGPPPVNPAVVRVDPGSIERALAPASVRNGGSARRERRSSGAARKDAAS